MVLAYLEVVEVVSSSSSTALLLGCPFGIVLTKDSSSPPKFVHGLELRLICIITLHSMGCVERKV